MNKINCLIRNRMIGGGRHMASRRRGSSPMIRATGLEIPATAPLKGVSPRRRRAVAVQDHKSCALIQTRLKLGELVWVKEILIIIVKYPESFWKLLFKALLRSSDT